MKQPSCIVNESTNKPFTRHNYSQENLRVTTYVKMASGETAPYAYAFELVCKRCGYVKHCRYGGGC
jgi:hypothetical protein